MQSVPSKLQSVPNHYLFFHFYNMINRHEKHVGDAAIFPPSQRFRHEFMSGQAAYGAKTKILQKNLAGSPRSTPMFKNKIRTQRRVRQKGVQL